MSTINAVEASNIWERDQAISNNILTRMKALGNYGSTVD
jgi:hypothetical protein